ncbi:MAG: hypothetical protein J7598_04545 [Mitsuaria chitosanitabida]|uniref:hypothetical protein n=1 Tax=Roseateles chitosanitabidus TaxID=65048 RepID=UPI001B1E3B37|nr:hypothetical protein [Roseateles chitosanitabidus]MBO9685860.1 hypothetical protein [Roseateles chitosanitabidus]
MHATATPPRKTDRARELLAQGQRQLPGALRALLITVDGKRDADELRRLGRGLGLEDGLERLVEQGLVELPRVVDTRATMERARRLVSTKFFALDLVTRMLAGREGELRDLVRHADTESRFMAWVDLCCEQIEAQSDAERATKFRTSVTQTLAGA